ASRPAAPTTWSPSWCREMPRSRPSPAAASPITETRSPRSSTARSSGCAVSGTDAAGYDLLHAHLTILERGGERVAHRRLPLGLRRLASGADVATGSAAAGRDAAG